MFHGQNGYLLKNLPQKFDHEMSTFTMTMIGLQFFHGQNGKPNILLKKRLRNNPLTRVSMVVVKFLIIDHGKNSKVQMPIPPSLLQFNKIAHDL